MAASSAQRLSGKLIGDYTSLMTGRTRGALIAHAWRR
jgi:hypothetical protein